MTSNFPDKLDKALIRPGRVDINLKVGYCDNEMIEEMFYYFYKLSDKTEYCFSELNIVNQITPAQLTEILLDNFNSHKNAYNDIIKFVQ